MRQSAICQQGLKNDAKATTSEFAFFSLYRDDSYLLCQMYANPSEFEFQGTIFKFRKRSKISSLLVHVLHKTCTPYSCKSGEEMYDTCKVVVLLIKPVFFFLHVLVAVASLNRKVPNISLIFFPL